MRVCLSVCVYVQDLGNLEQIWELNQEWECAWDSWKAGQFMQMDTESMGLQAQGMLKRVVKLGREVKVGGVGKGQRGQGGRGRRGVAVVEVGKGGRQEECWQVGST